MDGRQSKTISNVHRVLNYECNLYSLTQNNNEQRLVLIQNLKTKKIKINCYCGVANKNVFMESNRNDSSILRCCRHVIT